MFSPRVAPRRGFTLIELLVVIAIIAILAVVVVLTLNPAQLLAQSRDSNRLSDLATLNSALNIYVTDQAGAPSFSLGSSTVTYISVPDMTATTTAGTDCTNEGGFLTGGYFHCDASSTNRNISNAGWIPVNFSNISNGAPFGSLPVDPVNQTSSGLYYTYQTIGSTFRLTASPESQKDVAAAGANPNMFIAGSANPAVFGGAWVVVPGNGTFGTGNFYAMKYDPSCAAQSTGIPLTYPTASLGIFLYNDGAQNCSLANGLVPSAIATGYPIGSAPEYRAAQYCASIGAHLMTNAEWQTIAWNAESQAVNWYGGVVGTNYMYAGHNNNSPGYVSIASADDSQNCIGTNGPASCGGTGSTNSQVRTFTLSNGAVIWDMSGNLYQWVSDTIVGTNEPHGSAAGWNLYEHNALTTWGSMSQQTVGPMNGAWSSTQGIGQVYSENATDGSTYGTLRGGNWATGVTQTGIETIALRTPTGGSGSPDGRPIGFRCTEY